MEPAFTVSTLLLWVVVLLNFVLTLGLARRFRTAFPNRDGLKIGQKAPEFMAHNLQGEIVTLGNFIEKPVVILFLSPDCDSCHRQIPILLALSPRAAEAGVELVLVSEARKEESESLTSLVDGQVPFLFAPFKANNFIRDYKMRAYPSYCFIDGGHRVRAVGFMADEIEAHIGRFQLEKR